MPLLDHFHPPLHDDPPWSSLATLWVGNLVRWLNRTLPRPGYVAYATVHLGRRAEADVAEYRADDADEVVVGGRTGAAVAVPPALASIAAFYPDHAEVRVGTTRHEMSLCGVVELVSPGNKKEPKERDAFVAKCASYLRRGIGVVVVDVVTERRANFHNLLMDVIGGPSPPRLASRTPTYVAGYRPTARRGRPRIDVWAYPAPVGRPLPDVPFALKDGPTLMLPVERAYTETLRDSNVPDG